jgi:hypothetical protein
MWGWQGHVDIAQNIFSQASETAADATKYTGKRKVIAHAP